LNIVKIDVCRISIIYLLSALELSKVS
jgi:hypothetical protein